MSNLPHAYLCHFDSRKSRTDDDAFLHLPLLEATLARLSCLSLVYLGAFAFSGYDARRLANCGFSWFGPAAYARYRCGERGAHPPIPFALGQLQVLSHRLVTALAAAKSVNAFAIAAEARAEAMSREGNDGFEDSVLGLVLTREVEPSLPLASIQDASGTSRYHTIVRVNIGAKAWHNLGCMSHTGMFRQPSRASMVVHGVRSSAAMSYVHHLMTDPSSGQSAHISHAPGGLARRGGETPDTVTCLNSLNGTEGPLSRMKGWCERCVGTHGAGKRLELPPTCQFGSDGRRGSRGQPMAFARMSCVRHGLLTAH